MSRPSLLAVALAGAAAAPLAQANGRFPSAQDVVIGGPSGDGAVAMRTTFGVLLRPRPTESFRWMCEAQLFRPLAPAGDADFSVALGASGRVFVGFAGGLHSSPDGCAVERDVGSVDSRVTDLASSGDGARVWALGQSPSGRWFVRAATAPDYVFSALGAGLDGVALTNLDAAPSDPRRVYVSGTDAVTHAPRIFRSEDGGATLTRTAAEGLETPAGPVEGAYLSAVDPTDPEVVYVRAGLASGTGLFRSRDGARSFVMVTATRAPMLGFALSDDGQTVWAGSAEGITRSTDGGAHFAPIAPEPEGSLAGMPLGGVSCLRFHAGVLWACTDWVRTGYALARSSDGGERFAPVMRFTDVTGAFECAPGLVGPMVCGWQWGAQRARIERGPTDAGPTEVITGVDPPHDGSVAHGAGTAVRGCGCHTPENSVDSRGYATMAALCGGLLISPRRAGRRRRRRPRRCSTGW